MVFLSLASVMHKLVAQSQVSTVSFETDKERVGQWTFYRPWV